MRGLRGPIEWPGDELTDIRRRPMLAAIAALHATTRVVIHALYSVHRLERPLSDDDPRGHVAMSVVGSAEQLLASLDLYLHIEQIPNQPRSRRAPNVPASPAPRWLQMSLPFPGDAAAEHARAAARERAR